MQDRPTTAPPSDGLSLPPEGDKSRDDLDLIFRTFRLEGERIIRLSKGKEAKGTPDKRGYLVVSAGSQRDSSNCQLRLHRVKFALAHGWLPVFIDHIDGDRQNNALANLRSCTKSENMANSSYRGMRPPTSGFRNVVMQPSLSSCSTRGTPSSPPQGKQS